jgi:hypothetical protein
LRDRLAKQPGADDLDVTLEAWISKRTRRINRIRLAGSHPEADGSFEITVDITDYGVPLAPARAPEPVSVVTP